MIRKTFTVLAILVATGGAFVGSSNAHELLRQTAHWEDPDGNTISTATAANCQNITDTQCAIHFNADGQQDAVRTNPLLN